jgi:hypothetical protein
MFLQDEDVHIGNIGVGGEKIDHGRAFVTKCKNAEVFMSAIEYVFGFRYGKYGFALDYNKLLAAFQHIKKFDPKKHIAYSNQQLIQLIDTT